MNSILSQLDDKQQEKLHKKSQPDWTDPMLAILTHDYFSDKDWIFERKLDGERCLVHKNGKSVTIYSRNKKTLNDTYPEIVEALKKQDTSDYIIDGEVVTFDGKVTSFSKLQHRMHLKDKEGIKNSKIKVYYYIFDVIYFDGYNLSDLGLRGRKKILKAMFDYADPLRYTIHRNKEGEAYFDKACKKGWEGLIAKKADGGYKHTRSSDWLKFKCVNQQEFVIGGYTDPEGERIGFGALLLGFYEKDTLRFAGKVGTGYDDEELKTLYDRLKKIEQEDSAFDGDNNLPAKHVHWVKPKYVAEVGFTEWTKKDKLRHPRYLGLRRDKDPKDVVKEK